MLQKPDARMTCLLALLAGIGAPAGCGQPAATPPGPTPANTSPRTVGVVHPERKSLRRVVEQPGTVLAFEETQLFARVPGYVRKLNVDIGQKIRGPKYDSAGKETEPGEVLAELAVPELEEESNQKQAVVRQAEAEVEQADKALASAQANIAVTEATVVEAQSANDRWESEWKRISSLVKSGVIDAQSRDETQNQFRSAGGRLASAKASVQKAKADRDKVEADTRAARARVDVARADAMRSAAMLGYAKIRAPYDGIVTWRKVNTGDFVQPAGGQGDWLVRVSRLDPVRIVIAVPEADAGLVQEKSEVKLTVQAVSGSTLSGSVARTSWALEPGARTLRTEIDLPNKDGRLRPGMYVHAQITGQLPEAWAVPVSAVVKQGDTMVCFLIVGGRAVRTPVQIGRSDGKFIAVLKRQTSGVPSAWEEFTGTESLAAPAVGLTDGQSIQTDSSVK